MNKLLAKAEEASLSAHLLFDRGSANGVTDRAYFAMFNAARALLAARGLNAVKIKNHDKVRALLSRYFIETSRIDFVARSDLKRANKARRVADFSLEGVDACTAETTLRAMDRFMRQARPLLPDGGGRGRQDQGMPHGGPTP